MERKELLKSKEFWIVRIQNQLYEELEKYLKDNKMSKTDFAKKMGVSKGYISQILNGDFDHKLSKLVEISLTINKVPIINLMDINDCLRIDKDFGIDYLSKEQVNIQINVNFNKTLIVNKTASTLDSDSLKDKTFSFSDKYKSYFKQNSRVLN